MGPSQWTINYRPWVAGVIFAAIFIVPTGASFIQATPNRREAPKKIEPICPSRFIPWRLERRRASDHKMPSYITPLGVHFGFYNQFIEPEAAVTGIRLNLIAGCNYTVAGIDLGILNATRYGGGIQAGFLNANRVFAGTQIGLANHNERALGMSFAWYNSQRAFKGVSLAAYANHTGEVDGIVIGGLQNHVKLRPGNEFDLGIMLTAGFNDIYDVPKDYRFAGLQIAGLINGMSGANRISELVGMQLAGIGSFGPHITGLQASGLVSLAASMRGLQIGTYAISDRLAGAQIGLAAHAKHTTGFQLAAAGAFSRHVAGLQTGIYTRSTTTLTGFQLGGINVAKRMSGMQIGLFNFAQSAGGIQIGFFNYAKRMSGLQIGVLNIIQEGAVPFFPVINFSASF